MTDTKDPATMTRAERREMIYDVLIQSGSADTGVIRLELALFPPKTREVPACVKWGDKTGTWSIGNGYTVTWTDGSKCFCSTLRSVLVSTVLPEDHDELLRVVTALHALPTAKPTIEVIDDD